MIPKIVPVTIFRTKALEVIRSAQKNGKEYVITAKGVPAAVVMGFDEWESLVETLEIKQDRELMQAIRRGRRFFKSRKKGKLHKDLKWDA